VWRAFGSQRARNARWAQSRLSRGMFRVRGLHATVTERSAVRGQSRRRTTVLPHRLRKGNISHATDRWKSTTRYLPIVILLQGPSVARWLASVT